MHIQNTKPLMDHQHFKLWFLNQILKNSEQHRLCICEECQRDYGSCDLFKSCKLSVEKQKQAVLPSNDLPTIYSSSDKFLTDDTSADTATIVIVPDSVVAAAAPESSSDTFWIIKATEDVDCFNPKNERDDYGHVIPAGNIYMKGHLLERVCTLKDSTLFNLSKKKYLYKDSVVYPFVEIEEGKNVLMLSNTDI